MNKTRVAIIGSGASGLLAARTLKEQQIDFTLLEASSHIGGRAMRIKAHPHIELGPEFLHGETPETDRIMEELGEPFYDVKFDYHVFESGVVKPVSGFWNIICKVISEMKVDRDMSVKEYLENYSPFTSFEKKITSGFIEGFQAADLEIASTEALSEMKNYFCQSELRKMRRPLSGYGIMMERLAESVFPHIHFNHIVEEISWSPKEVIVSGNFRNSSFEFRAEKVICTIPLPQIKNLRFNPALKQLEDFFPQVEMGQVVKLIADFEPDFFHHFKDHTFPFIASPDQTFTAWWTTTPIHSSLVTGWAGGQKAIKLSRMSGDEKKDLFLSELGMISGIPKSELTSLLRYIHHHDWNNDPFVRGAYSYGRVFDGERSDPETSFEDTVFLAGEAFHAQMSGTIEGALQTGKHAAEKAIKSLSKKKAGISAGQKIQNLLDLT